MDVPWPTATMDVPWPAATMDVPWPTATMDDVPPTDDDPAMTRAGAMTAARDHSMDFYRVAALVFVVLGHWVAASLTYRDGSFWRENPLVQMPWTQWLTWMFQVVPVFFVVAGYASAVSWSRHRHNGGDGRQAWLRHRLTKPLGPTAVYVVFALAVVAVLRAAGVAGAELDFGAWAVAMHLWFLGVYAVMIALTPVAMAAHRRWGLAVPAALAVAVAVVDLATIGAQLPHLGWVNHLLPWAVLYQLGIAWHAGMLRGCAPLLLASCSAVALVLLVTVGPYPVSMIGVPGQTLQNTSPPNLAILALGVAQAGVVLAAAPLLNRVLNSPRRQRILAVANDNVMALYLWHMVPVVIVALIGYPTGLLPQPPLGSAAWWLARLEWLVVLAMVAALELVLLWWGRALFAAPLPTLRVPITPRWGEPLVLAGTALTAGSLSWFAALGFAPNGDVPVATAVCFLAGLVLVAVAPRSSVTAEVGVGAELDRQHQPGDSDQQP